MHHFGDTLTFPSRLAYLCWHDRAGLERWIIALPPGWQRSHGLGYC